jgi:hypothetical protein
MKWADAGVDSSGPLASKNGASQKGKGGRDEKEPRGNASVSKYTRGVKITTMATLLVYTCALNRPSQRS